MSMWGVHLILEGNSFHSIKIKNEIFQSESLSPSWFYVSLNPLSSLVAPHYNWIQIKWIQTAKKLRDENIPHVINGRP